MHLEDTIRAIRQADAERQRRVSAELRRRRPVAQVDQILQELEETHLRGGVKVPGAMIPRIERLLSTLPVECRREFPLRTTITRVMDNLYAIQDDLLTLKDERRARLRQADGDRDDYPAAEALG